MMRRVAGKVKRGIFAALHPFVVTKHRVAFGERNHYGINPSFYTVDMANADACLNFNDTPRLPLQDTSVKVLFTSHALEHLSENMVSKFLEEVHRVLRPDGILLVELPDCERLYKAWQSGHRALFDKLGFSKEVFEQLGNIHLADRQDVAFAGIISCKIIRTRSGGEQHAPVSFRSDVFEDQIRTLSMDHFFSWLISLQTQEESLSGGHVSAWYPSKFSRTLKGAGFRESRELSGDSRVPKFLFRGGDRKSYSFRMIAQK